MRRILALTLLLASVALPARAVEAYTLRLAKIPVSFPDDAGNPVFLDASIAIPATGTPPYPAMILNHGFLGDRGGDGYLAEEGARNGYIVMRYSSRGWGQTGGEVDLVGMKERQDLLDAVDWLNDPANVPEVWPNHIAQIGGSYGGGHAMSLAVADHPAVRAIAPLAAWSDMYRALVPNDVPKLAYANGFYAAGVITEPIKPRYSNFMHRLIAQFNADAHMADLRDELWRRSTRYQLNDIHTPMFLVQGWNDGLFQAEELIDVYKNLRARGVPAFLYLGGIGHPPAIGDTDGPEARHVGERLIAWFDHYVKGIDNGIDDVAPIEFSNASWDGPRWDGTTLRADAFPFGPANTVRLCASVGSVATAACPDSPVALVNTYANANPTGEPLTGPILREGARDYLGREFPDTSTRADTVVMETPPFGDAVQYAGTPRFSLDVISSSAGAPVGPGPVHAFQIDPRIYDVAPDGKAILVTRGAYAESLGAPVGSHIATFEAFGFAYRFAKGHRLRVVLSTSDAPYLRPASNPFTVVLGPNSTLELPGAQNAVAN